jgi:hypothetical protein
MRQVIEPPTFTPTPFGLLTTVEWTPVTNDYWQNGVTYQPMCDTSGTSLGSTTYDECLAVTGAGGPPPPPASLSGTISTDPRGATVFTVFAEFDCASVGNAQAQTIAERALSMAEPWQVERAFWTGVAGDQKIVYPHLAANAEVLDSGGITLQTAAVNVGATGTGSPFVTGDLPNIETAIGLLEGALANCYGGVGVIHVPQMIVPTMDAWNIIRAQGPVMRTLNGNKVAVGEGYPGTSPTGAARTGNSCWIYATGNVFAIRSEIRVRAPQGAPSLDRSTNTMKMIAERTYVLGWDCCHFAVQAALGVPRGT